MVAVAPSFSNNGWYLNSGGGLLANCNATQRVIERYIEQKKTRIKIRSEFGL